MRVRARFCVHALCREPPLSSRLPSCSQRERPRAPSATPTGSWTGTYTLRGEDSITLTLSRGRATVALGGGHAGLQTVPASVRNGRLRFSLPGVPRVSFDGRLRGGRIVGAVRQGPIRGTFRLRARIGPRASSPAGSTTWAAGPSPSPAGGCSTSRRARFTRSSRTGRVSTSARASPGEPLFAAA